MSLPCQEIQSLKLLPIIFISLICLTVHSAFAQTTQYQPRDTPYICNQQSDFTNLRFGPSARKFPVIGTLANGLQVEIINQNITPEGYNYYFLSFSSPGYDNTMHGYVHEDVLSDSCSLTPVYSPKIKNLAAKLGLANNEEVRKRILVNNANYDGTALYLNHIPELRDITALANERDLQHLDLSQTGTYSVQALAALTQLKYLDLSNSKIRSIQPLAALSKLETLSLYETNVSTLPSMRQLKSLY